MKIDEFAHSSEWIHQLETSDHWLQYWKQQDILSKILSKGDSIVEVGLGSGFTTNYLRAKGYKVTSADIDEAKTPDLVINIATEDLPTDFDVLLAFEVFEHIPLKYLRHILQRLRMRVRKYLVISLPDHYPTLFSMKMRLPLLKNVSFSMKRPRFFPKREMTDHHHWEVNHAPETRLRSLKNLFIGYNYDPILHEEFQNLHYFILKNRV